MKVDLKAREYVAKAIRIKSYIKYKTVLRLFCINLVRMIAKFIVNKVFIIIGVSR